MRAAGYPTGVVHHRATSIKKTLMDFSEGKLKVCHNESHIVRLLVRSFVMFLWSSCAQAIVSVHMLNEGFDVPSVDFIVLARPTDSEIVFTQQLVRPWHPSFLEILKWKRTYSIVIPCI
jgi:hypothetical protein